MHCSSQLNSTARTIFPRARTRLLSRVLVLASHDRVARALLGSNAEQAPSRVFREALRSLGHHIRTSCQFEMKTIFVPFFLNFDKPSPVFAHRHRSCSPSCQTVCEVKRKFLRAQVELSLSLAEADY